MGYGWTQAALLVQVLENAEAPTRLAVMESMHNFEASEEGVLLPGVTVHTGDGDNFLGEAYQTMQYEFEAAGARNHFVLIGTELTDVEGETLDLTPEDLING